MTCTCRRTCAVGLKTSIKTKDSDAEEEWLSPHPAGFVPLGTMMVVQRAISLQLIWCLFLLAALFQRNVVAVECFAGPVGTGMTTVQHGGSDAGDPPKARTARPLLGGIQEMRPDATTSISRRRAAASVTAAMRWRGGGASGGAPSLILIPFSYLRRLPAFVAKSKTRCAITLCISILGECVSTSLNKYSKVHQSPRALLAAMALYLMTVMGFNMSLAKIEVGVAYAIWSALGSLVVSTVGIVYFGESCDASKLACLLLIVIGVVGLNLRG